MEMPRLRVKKHKFKSQKIQHPSKKKSYSLNLNFIFI